MPKPVVMAVDDDPAAIGRISEELQRRYGIDYDVVCGQSATEALRRLESMRVDPAVERPTHLKVGEASARLDVSMFRGPKNGTGAHLEATADPRPVLESTGLLQDLDPVPGRHQTLEGARPRVPGERLLGRNRQRRPPLDDQLCAHGSWCRPAGALRQARRQSSVPALLPRPSAHYY